MSGLENQTDIYLYSFLLLEKLRLVCNFVHPEKTQQFLDKAIKIILQSDDESKMHADLENLHKSMVK